MSQDKVPVVSLDSIVFRSFQEADRDAVVALWHRCNLVVPWNDPDRDIDRKLLVRPEWFLIGDWAGQVIATLMVGYEGHRGWLNYLAVDPAVRRHGIGRRLVAHAEQILRDAGCPKICLQVRAGNAAALEFYRALGFDKDDVIGLGKRLVNDQLL
jgi:ribosomal protein S18 acetylase RimI-like enzyme